MSKPWSELRAFGTAGLTAVDKNPGSYAYLAVVDPATRAGIVGGWLTHDRGSGVVFSPVENDAVRMVAQIDYGRLRIKPGQDARTETFASAGSTMRGRDWKSYADAIARVYCDQVAAAAGRLLHLVRGQVRRCAATKSTSRNWPRSPPNT